MKTAYIKAPFQVEFREVPLRALKDNELLVRVELCGICGSDIHSARSQAVDWETFGHEVVGVVEKIGRSVANVKVGDRGGVGGSCDAGAHRAPQEKSGG